MNLVHDCKQLGDDCFQQFPIHLEEVRLLDFDIRRMIFDATTALLSSPRLCSRNTSKTMTRYCFFFFFSHGPKMLPISHHNVKNHSNSMHCSPYHSIREFGQHDGTFETQTRPVDQCVALRVHPMSPFPTAAIVSRSAILVVAVATAAAFELERALFGGSGRIVCCYRRQNHQRHHHSSWCAPTCFDCRPTCARLSKNCTSMHPKLGRQIDMPVTSAGCDSGTLYTHKCALKETEKNKGSC